ncbi:MAG: response regulator, partial [Acidobacteria bacterium]
LGQRKMIDLRAGATEKPERQRVLVVDDETSIVTLLTTVLTREGFEVEGVHDGRSALQRIESGSFDHILLDIKMPDLDGKQIYQLVRNLDPQMAERIVFITGDASSPETFDFILGTGNKYLKKPFTLQEIKAVLVPFLRNYAPA